MNPSPTYPVSHKRIGADMLRGEWHTGRCSTRHCAQPHSSQGSLKSVVAATTKHSYQLDSASLRWLEAGE